MSASWALIRFKKTGNVYMGCYEGTSDTMNPYICTAEECWDEKWECYSSITECRKIAAERDWVFPDNISDLDEVEVYSDYGGGFYWNAVGSETIKMIDNPLDEFNELDFTAIKDGQPDWVDKYWDSLVCERLRNEVTNA